MPIEVTMPKLTDSMEEGHIVEWKVAAGDRVHEGDVLAEIETDKAVMELESFWSGEVSEILRDAGDVVAVGEVIARIVEAGEAAEAVPAERPVAAGRGVPDLGVEGPGEPFGAVARVPAGQEVPRAPSEEKLPEATAAPQPRFSEEVSAARPSEGGAGEEEAPGAPGPAVGKEIPIPGGHPLSERGGVESARPASPAARPTGPPGMQASPRARKLAKDKGLELTRVQGTGPGGRITAEDVATAASRGSEVGLPGERPPSERPVEPAAAVRAPPAPADRADEELPPISFSPEEAEVEDVSFYQKAAIRRVVASKHVIPHFYVTKAVRADALIARKEAEREGSGATLTHFIMRACALALEKYPEANRSYDRGRWIRWKVVHLGLAVQTEAGLVVAVLRDAGVRDLAWLAKNTRALVEKARAGKLSQPERTNPTFTISNLGAYDVESFAAIINPPSALTLAVGSVVQTPVVAAGRVEVGNVLHLTLSCDHRVVDGVLAAEFLGEVKRLLEEPEDTLDPKGRRTGRPDNR